MYKTLLREYHLQFIGNKFEIQYHTNTFNKDKKKVLKIESQEELNDLLAQRVIFETMTKTN